MNLLPWSGYAMEVSLSIGSAGLLIIIFRIIYQLISPIPNDTPVISMRTSREAAPIIVFSSIILLLMLIAGLFPGIFSGLFKGILAPFEKIFLLS
jgi:cytochrome b561